MKEIKLGIRNDTYTFAVLADGRYFKLADTDLSFEQPDAQIFFDSGVYPGIADVDQYMCDKASRSEAAARLGSITSDRKAAAARENGQKGGCPARTRIANGIGQGFWTEYRPGYIASAWETDTDAGIEYGLSLHRGENPAFEIRNLSDIDSLIVNMREVQPDLRKWKLRTE